MIRKRTPKQIALGLVGGFVLGVAMWHLAWGPCRTWWDWRVRLASPIIVPALLGPEATVSVIRQRKLGDPEYLVACFTGEAAASYQGALPTLEECLPGTPDQNARVLLPPLFLIDCQHMTAQRVGWEQWGLAEGQAKPRGFMDGFYGPPLLGQRGDGQTLFAGKAIHALGQHDGGRIFRDGMPVFGLGSRDGPRNSLSGSMVWWGHPSPHYMGREYVEWRDVNTGVRVGPGYQLAQSASLWPNHANTEGIVTPDRLYYIAISGDRVWIIPIPSVGSSGR